MLYNLRKFYKKVVRRIATFHGHCVCNMKGEHVLTYTDFSNR